MQQGSLELLPIVLDQIQRRVKGVLHAIGGEVWEFLLGCFDLENTFDEHKQIGWTRRFSRKSGMY